MRTVAFLVALVPAFVLLENTRADNRPNMIFVMSDDQGWGDVAYNGHPILKTPHLDSMAESGLRFDRFYAGASVCSPTRASCLTGRNNWRMDINGPLAPDEGHLPATEITLAEVLTEHGYATGHFGKWHVGGFDAETAGPHVMPPWHAGFQECFSTHNVLRTFNPYNKLGKGGIKACYWHNGRNIPLTEAQQEASLRGDDAAIVMNKAITFIQQQSNKPFLAFIWFHNVHTPLGKNPDLMAQYSGCSDQEQIYFSNITAVDKQIGRLRAALRECNLANNTMLWFTSDNGPNLKGKKNPKIAIAQNGKFTYTALGSTGAFRGWKRDCYEGGLRVPGILEWPSRIKKPRRTDFPAVTSDYFPTALAAAGLPLPDNRTYDGINLLPIIEQEVIYKRPPIGFHCNGMEAWTSTPYKIIRSIKNKKREDLDWELYDLIQDPFEEHNLATSKPALVKKMAAEFDKWAAAVQMDKSGN
ncbi:MAG TPA: N-acetylgalactosamine 6-sulfate sulfatase [Planctomycetaceae bacterium]|nr:N-acetylgalactosamine 6-sulfate sulfatase [Planctomycetaceae bacterium]